MEQAIAFKTQESNTFIKELRKNVDLYFKENNKSKEADWEMVIKTIAILGLYLIPYFLIVFNVFTNSWLVFAMWIIMALGMAGIGFSIAHDANHGTYSKNQQANKILAYLINIIGGSSVTWKIQHNVLHHTYTNIHEHDEDLNIIYLLRFSYQQKRLKVHRFQQYYAWFLYSLLTVSWTTKKDFLQLKRYRSKDLIKTQHISYKEALTRLIFSKVFYYSFILIIPIIFSSQAWWLTLIFYLSMHLVCGFIISTFFQLAHKVAETSFPLPDEEGRIETNWATHQLLTTSNFANKNRVLSWYVGGINFQIEHHLFPNICHVHHRGISNIVKETAKAYDLPYYESTLWEALKSHMKYLTELGKYDEARPEQVAAT